MTAAQSLAERLLAHVVCAADAQFQCVLCPLLREAAAARSDRYAEGWISVKERLPECSRKKDSFGVPVLVHQPANKERAVFEAYYGKRVTPAPAFYLFGGVLDGITHWRALPPAPGMGT